MNSSSSSPGSLSRRAKTIQASPIRKLVPLADAAKKRGLQVFHLNIGQPDIPTPSEYWKEIGERVRAARVLEYGPSPGIPELRRAIGGYYEQAGISIALEEVLITTGGSEAVTFAMSVVTDPGDEILCFEPFYTNYNGFASLSGISLKPVRTSGSDGFHLPPDEVIEAALGPRTRAILICSPNNPTGTVLRREELERLAGLVCKHNLFLLADEVYRDFAFDGRRHTSTLEIPEIAERLVVMDSISKRFSSCGARIGNLVSRNKEIIAAVTKFAQARLCPPTEAQYGATVMYQQLGPEYFSEVSRIYERRRDVLVSGLEGVPGVFFRQPEGAFYAMIQIPVDSGDSFAAWMLTDFSDRSETTMVAPGAGFYASTDLGHNEIRIAYVLEEAKMKRALEILRKGIEAYPGRKQ